MVLDRHLCSSHFEPPIPPKSDIILNVGCKDSFRTSCTALSSNHRRLLILDSPQIFIIPLRLVVHAWHPECHPLSISLALPYFISYANFSLLTQSHNFSQLSILYSTIPVWSTYPHFPTPHTTQHITSCFLYNFFFISTFVHLASILIICLRRSRIVLCHTSERRLSYPNSQIVMFSN